MMLLIFPPNISYKTNFFCQTPLFTSYGVMSFHEFIYLLPIVNKTHRHIIDTRQWICSNFSTFQMTVHQQFQRKNLCNSFHIISMNWNDRNILVFKSRDIFQYFPSGYDLIVIQIAL